MNIDKSETVEVVGGYDIRIFIDQQAAIKYACCICNNVLKDAIQIPTSVDPKRACRSCYVTNIRDGKCPIFGTHNTSYYPDKCAEREINELKVICANRSNGCAWSNCFRDCKNHLDKCEYRWVTCEDCKGRVVLKNHNDVCPNVPITCPACSLGLLRKNFETHKLNCQMQSRLCECGEEITQMELARKLPCHWNHTNDCIFSYIGCEIDKTHDDGNHQALLVSTMIELKQQNIVLQQKSEEKDMKIEQQEKQINQLQSKIEEITKTLDSLTVKLKNVSQLVETHQFDIDKLKQNGSQPAFSFLGTGGKFKKDSDDMRSKVNALEDKNEAMKKSLTDMDLKIQLEENKTKTGELIWKIDRIDYRLAQAKMGKMVALHSAPCYTGQYQYKYCTRLYLYGDGMGRSTHISIFFVVMKSEYDELLTWPMHKRIRFELINVFNEADSVSESFVSNINSSSFQRPTNNMNVASGCPMFVTIERFLTGGFIKDNCAYIRTTVTDVN